MLEAELDELDRVGVPAWSRTFMRSRGLPIRMPAAPEIYPAQKSADMVKIYENVEIDVGSDQAIIPRILSP